MTFNHHPDLPPEEATYYILVDHADLNSIFGQHKEHLIQYRRIGNKEHRQLQVIQDAEDLSNQDTTTDTPTCEEVKSTPHLSR